MKILQVTAPGEFVVLEAPTPEPGPGEVLMRILAVTTCPQWDLHLRHNEPMFVGHRFHYPYPPGQPGHEATGVIESIGPGVTELNLGDRVSAWRDCGPQVQGCYAEYVVRKPADLVRVPPALSCDSTAPVELAMCVGATFLMLEGMNVLEGRTFAVSGLGPAGLIAAQMARAGGAARVLGFDPSPARRAAAQALGVDETFDPRDTPADRFPARPGAPQIDTSIDCVGARASAEFLMDRSRDVVALFGVQREDFVFAVRHYSLRLCGYPGHSRAAADYAVKLMERGLLDLEPLSTHHLPLERYNEGIELLERQEAIKVCFWPFGMDGF
ncbi:MAG: zinc-binding dehydrogenase [Chloroflexi bacterium]|nr:zinc-binding dehydrogenase [Chloroflexota bacterium]